MRKLLLAVVILVSSCVTYVQVANDEILDVVNNGDFVRVVTVSGGKHRYLVEAVESDALVVLPAPKGKTRGTSERLGLADIALLEMEQQSLGKTFGFVAGTAVGLLGLLVVVVWMAA